MEYLFMFVAAFSVLFEQAVPPKQIDLSGIVLDPVGRPIRAASVFIYSAEARTGTDPNCPTCHADCDRSATSGDDGNFRIRSIDANLIYRILIIADNFEPIFMNKIDPLESRIKASLKPLDPSQLKAGHYIRGRVIGPEGNAVIGAEVVVKSFRADPQFDGAPVVVDAIAVTNLQGQFILNAKQKLAAARLAIKARRLSPGFFDVDPPLDLDHPMKLERGASVTGRLVRDGTPIPGVLVGLVQVNRNKNSFLGRSETATDKSGKFIFDNVFPNERYYVYGVMRSLRLHGCLRATEIRVDGDKSISDIGELHVVPGHRLEGKIVLSDGNPIPRNTHLMVARDQAWDFQRAELDENGHFALEGFPAEEYTISSHIEGYHLSMLNLNANPVNPHLLQGMIDRDINDLIVLYEPDIKQEPKAQDGNVIVFHEGMRLFNVRRKQLIRGINPAPLRGADPATLR